MTQYRGPIIRIRKKTFGGKTVLKAHRPKPTFTVLEAAKDHLALAGRYYM